VGLKAPTLSETLAPVGSLILTQPRLRNVLQRIPLPVLDVPTALHTTISATWPRTPPGSRGSWPRARKPYRTPS
ncbi:MAG TPA: hypothetical protein VGI45_33810, partial [Terracidiphilus sp.]